MLGCESAAAARASRSKRAAVGARGERLDGDAATELLVLGEPDGAHRAPPERLVQAVAPCDQIPGHAGDYREVRVDDLPGIDEALDQVLSRVQPIAAEAVPIAAAAGRVLAQDARAVVDLPPFAELGDGRLRRACADTPGRLPVGGQSAAGSPLGRPQARARRSSISTGAVVPEGADAVVPVEDTERDGDVVHVAAVAAGAHVRPRGRRCAQRGDDRLAGPAARADPGRCARGGRARVRRVRAQAAGRRARDRLASCARRARRSGRARSTSRTRR